MRSDLSGWEEIHSESLVNKEKYLPEGLRILGAFSMKKELWEWDLRCDVGSPKTYTGVQIGWGPCFVLGMDGQENGASSLVGILSYQTCTDLREVGKRFKKKKKC
jgi:hypothetical protein